MRHFILPQNITAYIINNTTCHQLKKDKGKLEWQRFVNNHGLNWEESKTLAKILKLNGDGWKLPELNELKGLVNKNFCLNKHMYYKMSLNFICFGNHMRSYFWSASPVVGGFNYAWYVYFSYGNSGYGLVSNNNNVRCVR